MTTSLDPAAIASTDSIVKALVSDLAGGLREIIFPSRVLPELLATGIAYDGSSFQGINIINNSDAILRGVAATLVAVPPRIADSDKPEYWVICDILTTTGKPHPNCARSGLLRLQDELAAAWGGGALMMGAEPEAYFVPLDEHHRVGEDHGGNSNYFNPRDAKSTIITEISNTLDAMNFDIERAHTEVGDDQFEINWRFDRAERTADKIQFFKLISHKIAQQHGYEATFLPKPYPSRNGSGMHCHLSVQANEGNLFYDSTATESKFFSATALQFLTGILQHSRALAAIANRTEVSYSRLVPGFEAPCIVAIGEHNRSAACRIPAFNDPSLIAKALRAEFRYPDPLANPYLLAAGFIAAGLDGIARGSEFAGFTDDNLYECSLADIHERGLELLPRNLWEAYGEFTASTVLRERLGESMHDSYAEILLNEIDSCQPFANRESMRRHYFA